MRLALGRIDGRRPRTWHPAPSPSRPQPRGWHLSRPIPGERWRTRFPSPQGMSRHPRYLPADGGLVEVTYRTVQGRHLLRPSPELNATVLGVLARSLQLCPDVGLVGIVVLSNHLHLLLTVPDAGELSKLMEHFGGQSARAINRLHGWSGPLWARRYRAICVTQEPEAQIARLAYLLAQGVKEGLVARVAHWPGIHFGKVLQEGRSQLRARWVDRTRQYRAEQRGKQLDPDEVTHHLTIELVPLPCWRKGWGPYVAEVARMIRHLERTAAAERRQRGATVLGVNEICRQDPHGRPAEIETYPAPRVHAATKRVRRAWNEAFGWFLAQYREASQRLRRGDLTARFPEGCFPPRLPFIGGAGGQPRQPAPA